MISSNHELKKDDNLNSYNYQSKKCDNFNSYNCHPKKYTNLNTHNCHSKNNSDYCRESRSNCHSKNIRLISGIVKDKDNNPIPNTLIAFSSIIYCPCSKTKTTKLIGYSKTNSNGVFAFYVDISKLKGDYFKISIFDTLKK